MSWRHAPRPARAMGRPSRPDSPSASGLKKKPWLRVSDCAAPLMTGGDIWLFGGAKTAARFLAADLIDRIELAVVPTALGSGLPLFDGASHARQFKIVRAEPKDGLVMIDYARAHPSTSSG